MKVSLIIAVYKDVQALKLIFESLAYQTYKNFEVIVAEDGESLEVEQCTKDAKKTYNFDIIHTIQDDNGVRKQKSQNNGIRASSGEYLIFIDGDCVLYSTFIQNHVLLSSSNNIVTGRRVNVGPKYSTMLRKNVIKAKTLENKFVWYYFDMKKDAKEERHTEEGFSIKFNGLIHNILKKRKKEMALLGCNMSMYKSSILEINGFDEGLGNAGEAGDTDLQWRFKGLGYKIISGRFLVNQFHLYHKRSSHYYLREESQQMKLNQKNRQYVCKKGII